MEGIMRIRPFGVEIVLLLASAVVAPAAACADNYADAIKVFRNSDQSKQYFDKSYGYALFPTIGKGGFGIGGAHGSGRVYERGNYVGNTSMTQVTIGFQLGGQAYSQIVFFQDKRAFEEFTSGEFEFGAQATAVAITAGASASAATNGAAASAGTSANNSKTSGSYYKGMAVFTVAKGGLMYEASVGGQKFGYKPKKAAAAS
jgi:lipid-binding SYLF domain-containing protein